MQSFSPFIVKHYIPFDFSKDALDYKPIHHKIVNTHDEKQEIPFQNIKLKLLQRDNNKQLVLTYKNKSNKLFIPKRKVEYRRLIDIIEDENIKQKLIIQQLQNQHKQNVEKQHHYSKNHQRTSFSRDRYYQIEQSTLKHNIQRYKTNQNYRNVTGRQHYSNNDQKRIFTSENKYRNHISRLHSSVNNRQNMRRAISQRRIKNPSINSPQHNKKQFSFKIKGKKAPQAQMVDHLRKSTIDTLNNYNHY